MANAVERSKPLTGKDGGEKRKDEKQVVQATKFHGEIDDVAGLLYKSKKYTEQDSRQHYQLFGEDIPGIDTKLADEVKGSQLETIFKPGNVVENKLYRYEIEGIIGDDSYYVKDIKFGGRLFLKIESVNMPHDGPKLRRDVRVLLKAREVAAPFRKHFLKLIDRGQLKNRYNFIVTRLGGENLVDLRAKNRVDFLPSTAVRLALQSLQAIHDVHLCGFIHRDIQPKNFVIGREKNSNVLYVVNFGLGCPYVSPEKDGQPSKHRIRKLPLHNMNFQSRTFHRGGVVRRLHDIESWCYMVHYLFNTKCLPWDAAAMRERELYNRKWLFFVGHYDDVFMRNGLPRRLRSIRERINLESSLRSVDYPVFGEALLSIGEDLHVDWFAPLEWEAAFEPWARAKVAPITELATKQDAPPHVHPTGTSCENCRLVAAAKQLDKPAEIIIETDAASDAGSAHIKVVRAIGTAESIKVTEMKVPHARPPPVATKSTSADTKSTSADTTTTKRSGGSTISSSSSTSTTNTLKTASREPSTSADDSISGAQTATDADYDSAKESAFAVNPSDKPKAEPAVTNERPPDKPKASARDEPPKELTSVELADKKK